MNSSLSIDQKASVREVSGDVQIIREGYFYPAKTGMELLAGDRITTSAGASVKVDFSGTVQDLVVKDGSAASLFVQVSPENPEPQWMVADLYGQDVYFLEEGMADTQVEEPNSLYGLFGGGEDAASFPVAETVAAAGATAVVLSEAGDNDSTSSNSDADAMTMGDMLGGNDPDDSSDSSGDPDTSDGPMGGETMANPIESILSPLGSAGPAEGLAESLGRTDDALGISTTSTPDAGPSSLLSVNSLGNLLGN